MNRRWVLLTCAVAAICAAQATYSVSGFGGFPISKSMTSMWLAAPDRRPLLMVYFNGPEGWHDTQWKFDSKFEKGKPGWAELKSEKVMLRLWVNTDTGEAEIQSDKFKLAENNTFLVLHTGALGQKVVPLGVFSIPASKEQPASILLLEANPTLTQRIETLTKAD